MTGTAGAPILIAGGGIAGLTLALSLARRGMRSHIIERRGVFSESGAGIQLSPNGVHVLDKLGLRPAMDPLAGRPSAIHVHEGRSGRLLQRLPLGRWINERHGAPYLLAHRRDLQDVLLEAVRRQPMIEITRGFELARFTQTAAGIVVNDAGGRAISGAALIGADGVASRVRQQICPTASPIFSGRTAARTVIAADRVSGHLDMNGTGVWLAPDAHVVHYPVRAGRELAVVVIAREPAGSNIGAAGGWSVPVPARDMERSVAAFAPRLRQALAQATDWRRWTLVETSALPTWSQGRALLIGDAAHPVLPFLAQGGSLALEDAFVLADLINYGQMNNGQMNYGQMNYGETDLAAVFRDFERIRRPRTEAVAKAAWRNGRIYHLAGLAAGVRNLGLSVIPPERLMAGYDWIYGWRP